MRHVDDIEDVNEHLLGLALVRTMRQPGGGVLFPEVAVTLVEAIKAEGWVPSEERDFAERKLAITETENIALKKKNEDYEADIIKLQKQVALLVSQLSGMGAYTPVPTTYPYPGTTSTPWITTTTSTSSSAIPAAQVAAEYLKHRRISGA